MEADFLVKFEVLLMELRLLSLIAFAFFVLTVESEVNVIPELKVASPSPLLFPPPPPSQPPPPPAQRSERSPVPPPTASPTSSPEPSHPYQPLYPNPRKVNPGSPLVKNPGKRSPRPVQPPAPEFKSTASKGPPSKQKQHSNLGKKVGFFFVGAAAILQLCVVTFLAYKRRQIMKFYYRF